MNDDLKLLFLAPLFAAAGALATAAAWQLFALTLTDLVPGRLFPLWCIVAGLAGPPLIWILVTFFARRRPPQVVWVWRRSATVGLGLVFASQLAFYLPLGFFAIAFH